MISLRLMDTCNVAGLCFATTSHPFLLSTLSSPFQSWDEGERHASVTTHLPGRSQREARGGKSYRPLLLVPSFLISSRLPFTTLPSFLPPPLAWSSNRILLWELLASCFYFPEFLSPRLMSFAPYSGRDHCMLVCVLAFCSCVKKSPFFSQIHSVL